jgi:KaiC/GvpD/RAD55 family RecA-like ATPase
MNQQKSAIGKVKGVDTQPIRATMTEQYLVRTAAHQHRTLASLGEFGLKDWMLTKEARQGFGFIEKYLTENDGVWPPEVLVVEKMGWQPIPLEEMPCITLRYASQMIVNGHGRSKIMEGINQVLRLLGGEADRFTEAFDVLRRTSDEVTQVVAGNAHSVSLYDLYPMAAERYEQIRSGELGIDMPWETASRACGGYKLGQFCVIVARPKTYKTWLLLHTAIHLRNKGLSVLFISPELTKHQLASRAACIDFKISYQRYAAGTLSLHEQRTFTELALGSRGGTGFHVREDAMRVDKAAIDGLVDVLDPDVVLIDSFYKAGEGRSSTDRIVDASDWASRLKTRGRPRLVLATSQFNRNVDGSADSVDADNIFGSDAILQDADMIHGLWKEREGEVMMRLLAVRDGTWHRDFAITTDLEKMDFSEAKTMAQASDDAYDSSPKAPASKPIDLSFLDDTF